MTRKNKQSRKEQPPGETELCYRHERPLSLFCRDLDCHKLLCHVCYIKHHNGHDAVDLISEAKKYKHELKDLILHTTDELTKCRDILNTQNDNTAKFLDDIEVNLNKFDDMMRDISEDPVKAITLYESYKNFIMGSKDQLSCGLKSLAKNVGSLGRRLGWTEETDEYDADGMVDEYEVSERYDSVEEYEDDCPEYSFSEGDGLEGKLAFCERKWYKLGTNVRDIIYSLCAGAGLFFYLTILHADKHSLLGIPKHMLVAFVTPSADKIIPQSWINSDPYYFSHG